MYKHWITFIEFYALVFYRTGRKVYDGVKVEHHGTVNKLTENMTVCMVKQIPTQTEGLGCVATLQDLPVLA